MGWDSGLLQVGISEWYSLTRSSASSEASADNILYCLPRKTFIVSLAFEIRESVCL